MPFAHPAGQQHQPFLYGNSWPVVSTWLQLQRHSLSIWAQLVIPQGERHCPSRQDILTTGACPAPDIRTHADGANRRHPDSFATV
jgi:hypothetical protein